MCACCVAKALAALEEGLASVETEMDQLVDEFNKEQAKLHWQMEKKKIPLYNKRGKLVADIPKFWLTAVRIQILSCLSGNYSNAL